MRTRKMKAADVHSSKDKWVAGMKSGPGTGDVGRDRDSDTKRVPASKQALAKAGWTGEGQRTALAEHDWEQALYMASKWCAFRSFKEGEGINLDKDANNKDGRFRGRGSSRAL